MTQTLAPAFSPLKDARLVRKIGKKLGMPGASAERLVARVRELQSLPPRGHSLAPPPPTHQVQLGRVAVQPPIRALDAIAAEITAPLPCAVDELSEPMKALRRR